MFLLRATAATAKPAPKAAAVVAIARPALLILIFII